MTDGCGICGRTDMLWRMNRKGVAPIWACRDHRDRTKCSIENCTRSCSRPDGQTHEWICSLHWRRHCPPRSLRRRVYLRYHRDARRHGWTDLSVDRYWRFWDLLIRLANQAERAGTIDEAEINRMFGWDE